MSRAVSSNLYSSIASRTTSLWPLPAAMWSIVWPWLVTEWSRESILGARYRMMSTWPPSAALCRAFCPLYKNRKNNKWTHEWKCTLTVYTKNDKSKQTVPFVCSEVTRQPGHRGYTNGSQSDGVCGGSGTECYVLWWIYGSANFTWSVVLTGQPCPMRSLTLSRSPSLAALKKAYCRPCTGDTILLSTNWNTEITHYNEEIR